MKTKSILTLRRRLTCLYTVTTSLILTIVLAASLLTRIRDVRQSQLDDFYELWDSLQFRLQSNLSISQSYLAQTETSHSSIIHIEENGSPLLFSGSWSPQTERSELIRRVKSLAEAENVFTTARPISSSSIISSLLTFQGDAEETYYGRVLVLPYGKSIHALCLISYVPPVAAVLHGTFLQLLILELLGIACLTAISWGFVGWSLKPVAESQQRQAEFIAAASHELRSPLAVLRSGIAALKATSAGNSGQAPEAFPSIEIPILSSLDSECARMARLIDDMLLLASADTKTWRLNRTQTDMDTLLIETYEAYLPLCRQKGLSLNLDLPNQPLPPVWADGERIRQVLSILLDNAMTYTPAGREIHIQAETVPVRKSSELLLHVTDQGPGIPDEEKSRIFDRFYRSDSSRSDKAHYGLGLSIAKELVSLHSGSIQVTDAKAGGSCFTVRLPYHNISMGKS